MIESMSYLAQSSYLETICVNSSLPPWCNRPHKASRQARGYVTAENLHSSGFDTHIILGKQKVTSRTLISACSLVDLVKVDRHDHQHNFSAWPKNINPRRKILDTTGTCTYNLATATA